MHYDRKRHGTNMESTLTPKQVERALEAARALADSTRNDTDLYADSVAIQVQLMDYAQAHGWYAYPGADRRWHVIVLQETQKFAKSIAPKTVLANGASWCWHCQEGHCDEHGVGV